MTNQTSGKQVNVTQSDLCQTVPCPSPPGSQTQKCLEISVLGYFVDFGNPCNNDKTEATIDENNDSELIDLLNKNAEKIEQLDIDTIIGGKKTQDGKITQGTALRVTLLNDYNTFTKEYYHDEWEQHFLWYINNRTVSLYFRITQAQNPKVSNIFSYQRGWKSYPLQLEVLEMKLVRQLVVMPIC